MSLITMNHKEKLGKIPVFVLFNSKHDSQTTGWTTLTCSLLLPSVRMLILESGSLVAILFYIGNEKMPPTKLRVTRVNRVLKLHFLHWICQILASTFNWTLSRLQTQSMRSGWGNRQIPFLLSDTPLFFQYINLNITPIFSFTRNTYPLQ